MGSRISLRNFYGAGNLKVTTGCSDTNKLLVLRSRGARQGTRNAMDVDDTVLPFVKNTHEELILWDGVFNLKMTVRIGQAGYAAGGTADREAFEIRVSRVPRILGMGLAEGILHFV